MNANNNSTSDNHEPEILEQGDIYFFYRPKKNVEEVKGIEDVRRFFMVTSQLFGVLNLLILSNYL
jgi:hypothetical protein